jgi:hypothetical protein
VLITTVKPNIPREQAVAKFRGSLSQFRHGRLRLAVDFYIPYHIFRLSWGGARKKSATFLAADAVTGALDLIEFDRLPAEREQLRVDTQRVVEARIADEEGYCLAREKMTRLVFREGFFKLTRMNSEVELAASLHIPYWVGVYEREGRAHLEIINALRGRFEGAKLREIVAEWFHPQG